jgi:hypothetical protein
MSAIVIKKLPEHLLLVEKATKQFLKETEGKSWEQFEAEIEALKHLLDYAKLIHPDRIERPFQVVSL